LNRRRAAAPRVLAFACACLLALALASCSHSQRPADGPLARATPPRGSVFVAIGSTATFGFKMTNPLREVWPQLLYHEAFPLSTVFVNAADVRASVAQALALQVPLALQMHATVVTVWLGDVDLLQTGVRGDFPAELDLLVRRLRDSGARVLLATFRFPRLASGAAAFNAAIERIARARGATLVDLASALAATPNVRPSALRLSAAANRAIAAAFASALASS
jgi:lysophospholipase L1-like esterase